VLEESDRRADVRVWSPWKKRVAIELQHSPIGVERLERRAFVYARGGIAQVWLSFLDERVVGTADGRRGGKDGHLHIRRYPAPHWQRWIHGFNFGEIWFYDPSMTALWRGPFSHCDLMGMRKKLKNGHENILQYANPSKRWRGLTLWGPYRPSELRIDLGYRAGAQLGRHNYPARPTARFVAPDPAVALGDLS
jgi:hypothetical protein